MNPRSMVRTSVGSIAAGIGLAAAAYGVYVGVTWYRYGSAAAASDPGEHDDLLDHFMPAYDVVERHHVRVAAPAAVTLAAAREMDLQGSGLVRTIIRMREAILGATPDDRQGPRGLLAEMQSLDWGVLAEVPGREVVVGAVTRPWEANVTFRALPPDQFAAFSEPGYVKIAWTLRADPASPTESLFRTETRAVAVYCVVRVTPCTTASNATMSGSATTIGQRRTMMLRYALSSMRIAPLTGNSPASHRRVAAARARSAPVRTTKHA